ncbi:hypothetical protein AWB74_08779 [Caballeronia arvi]|uniref:Uncharacterized protein n=1 Tax=Caballeronia arvi TaxID=1777135 RepID=A0A158L720_9BURK|nr:hypothetical protein AWB74_08779 [Caballeronia arvi]
MPIELFGFATEMHAPELVDLCLQAIEFLVSLNDLPVALGDLLAHLRH